MQHFLPCQYTVTKITIRATFWRLTLWFLVLGFISVAPLAAQSLAPRALWQRGQEAQLVGHWDDAITNFSALLNLYPDQPDVLLALGFSYFKHGDLDTASKLYDQVLATPTLNGQATNNPTINDPAPPDQNIAGQILHIRQASADYGLGQIAMSRQQWQSGVTRFQEVLRLAPDYEPIRARHNLALCLFVLKRYAEATPVYETALAQPVASHYPELYLNAMDNALAERKYAQAAAWGQQAVQLYPGNAWLWDKLAGALNMGHALVLSWDAYDHAEALVYQDLTPHHQTVLSLPFHGRWRVTQGNGGSRIKPRNQTAPPGTTNQENRHWNSAPMDGAPAADNHAESNRWGATHRGLGARFAWDFTAVDENGRSRTGWHGDNSDYYSFGQEVLAPADGRVVAVQDGTPDNEPYHPNGAPNSGNYVLIEHAPGELSSLGHLRNGSIEVKVGQRVQRGQRIALCGNSGDTGLPHLHYSFIGLYQGKRISWPAQFSYYVVEQGGAKSTIEHGVPEENSLVENVDVRAGSTGRVNGATSQVQPNSELAVTKH